MTFDSFWDYWASVLYDRCLKVFLMVQFSSVPFSQSVKSNSLRSHELQHTRLPCPSPNFQSLLKLMSIESAMPSNHLILCRPLLLLPSSFPSIRVFSKEWAHASSGQSIGASVSASVLPMNIQGWFPLGFTGLISLLSKGLSRVSSSTTVQRHQFFSAQPFLLSSSHICTWLTTGKTIALTIQTFVGKVMSLLFNMLSRFVNTFPRSKHLLI